MLGGIGSVYGATGLWLVFLGQCRARFGGMVVHGVDIGQNAFLTQFVSAQGQKINRAHINFQKKMFLWNSLRLTMLLELDENARFQSSHNWPNRPSHHYLKFCPRVSQLWTARLTVIFMCIYVWNCSIYDTFLITCVGVGTIGLANYLWFTQSLIIPKIKGSQLCHLATLNS